MVTPVDFHTPDNLLTHLIRHVNVDLLVDTFGNLPGQLLNFAFLSLSPFRLAGQKYVDVVDILDDAEALKNFLSDGKVDFRQPGSGRRGIPPVCQGFLSSKTSWSRARSSSATAGWICAISSCQC
jgi:hypothetical protein